MITALVRAPTQGASSRCMPVVRFSTRHGFAARTFRPEGSPVLTILTILTILNVAFEGVSSKAGRQFVNSTQKRVEPSDVQASIAPYCERTNTTTLGHRSGPARRKAPRSTGWRDGAQHGTAQHSSNSILQRTSETRQKEGLEERRTTHRQRHEQKKKVQTPNDNRVPRGTGVS